MDLKNRGRVLAAGLFAGALLGGGLAMVTPAGAVVNEAAAAINWKNIWKTEIKPRAKKTFYTKKAANARYYTKVQADSLYETKAAHDASMAAALGNYYTKAQADAKYAPYPQLVRGALGNVGDVDSGGDAVASGYSFGVAFGTAPASHIIAPGDPLPTGCLGTPAEPDALPGHLCIFPNVYNNVSSDTVCSAANDCPAASRFGFIYIAFSAGTGTIDVSGSWAARPAGSVTASSSAHPGGSAGSSGATGR